MFQLELGAPGNKINYPDPCSSDLMQGVLQHLDVGRVGAVVPTHRVIQRRSTELESAIQSFLCTTLGLAVSRRAGSSFSGQVRPTKRRWKAGSQRLLFPGPLLQEMPGAPEQHGPALDQMHS